MVPGSKSTWIDLRVASSKAHCQLSTPWLPPFRCLAHLGTHFPSTSLGSKKTFALSIWLGLLPTYCCERERWHWLISDIAKAGSERPCAHSIVIETMLEEEARPKGLADLVTALSNTDGDLRMRSRGRWDVSCHPGP